MEWGDILPYLTLVVTTVGLIVAAFWALMRWFNAATKELLDAKIATLSTQGETTNEKVDTILASVAEARTQIVGHVDTKIDALTEITTAKIEALAETTTGKIEALSETTAAKLESQSAEIGALREGLDEWTRKVEGVQAGLVAAGSAQ